MRIAIAGAGKVGRAIARELLSNGHEIMLVDRDPEKARPDVVPGATVLRGPLGFGHSGRIHTAKILDLAADLPLVIEIVDTEEKLMAFLDAVGDMVTNTLVTLEKVQVLQYGP